MADHYKLLMPKLPMLRCSVSAAMTAAADADPVHAFAAADLPIAADITAASAFNWLWHF